MKKTNANAETNINLSDDKNPKYMLQGVDTELIIGIIEGRIDPLQLAKDQLASRGLDMNGEWIGFAKAKEQFNN